MERQEMGNQRNNAQAKAQKKKVMILAVMVLGTGATWSKTLFGKDDKPSAASTSVVAVATAAAGTPAASVSTSHALSISTYKHAVKRMELWPKALNRQVHLGTIEELTPINDLLGMSDGENEGPEKEILANLPGLLGAEISPVDEEQGVAFEALHLRLTTTARFSKNTYAIISSEKVQVGDLVKVQVDGETVRYEVRAIGTRIVEIAFQGTTHILRIELPDLQRRDPDGD